MSIKLKIRLAMISLAAIFVVQTGVFYFQQQQFVALVSQDIKQLFVQSDSIQQHSDYGTQQLNLAKRLSPDDQKKLSVLARNDNSEMIIALLGVLFICAAESFFLIKSIVPPLKRATQISEDIAVGYLENKIEAKGNSEMDALLRSLAALQLSRAGIDEHLERQTRQTESAYFDMKKSSEELNKANANLSSVNASMDIMLSALNQGLFSFGADGLCSNIWSRACLSLLESSPSGRKITEVLHIPAEEESISRVLKLIFSDGNQNLDKGDLLALLPESFLRSNGSKISLSYHAIFDDEKKVQSILAVATDHSAEEAALKLIHEQEAESLRVIRISTNRNLFIQFYQSITTFFSALNSPASYPDSLETIRREIHTFKGNAGIFHLEDIANLLQEIESHLAKASDVAQARYEIIADLPKLQAVLTKTQKLAYDLLGRDFDQYGATRTLPLSKLGGVLARLKSLSIEDDLYKGFVETLMGEPIQKTFKAFDLYLCELADLYGKRVAPCYFTGDNFLLFSENYQALFASFSHIARNIIAHAIEPSDVRAERQKFPELTVVVETKKYKIGSQDWFRISFEDDGAGINASLLRKKIACSNSEEFAAQLTDAEVINYIFRDNFSTHDHADELSGRGVGLSAVKFAAEKLGGKVAVESALGDYTKIIIDVPFNWSALIFPT